MNEASEIVGGLDCEGVEFSDGDMVRTTVGSELTTSLGITVGTVDLYDVEELKLEGDRQVPESLDGC